MNKKFNLARLLCVISIVSEIIVLALLKFTFLPCISDKAMKCNNAHSVVRFLLVCLIVLSMVDLCIANNRNSCIISLCSHLLILFSMMAIPSFVIGGCMKPDMVCNTTTYPFIYLSSFLLMLLRIVVCVTSMKDIKRQNRN